ncbi:hypothetical protein JVT61DRAFT_13691 [Boletus reticuloceps]|uniref:Uncharacterized protein n=1 Tax=Boletus reticuloceps TaxID=495285 RepID=A0A8I2YW71_9AGAM|nr:hypothetical protein JVT61DRAFT_13691 [Boletus reticuloceps]
MKSRCKNLMAHARRLKSRSRSSTVASLAAPGPLLSPVLLSPSRLPMGSLDLMQGEIERTGSQSSIQMAIATSIREQENGVGVVGSGKDIAEDEEPVRWGEMGHEQQVAVMEGECQLREGGWCALREALEDYADEGDVQMCMMLALVAPEELNLGLGRTIQLVEAYVSA